MSSAANRDKNDVLQPSVRRTVEGVLRRYAIGGGLGLTVLAAGGFVEPAQAGAPPPHFGSAAWIAAKTGQLPVATAAAPAAGKPVTGGVSTPAQAATLLQQSIVDLETAANAVRGQLAAQAAAHSAAAAGSVPDGLAVGGLQVATATAQSPGAATTTQLPDGTPVEVGIKGISQSVSQGAGGAHTTVTVQQSAAQALVTWSSFNVGSHTTVDFDQSAGTQTNGNNSWVVLNRVLGSGGPSSILGSIKADGSVYLINQNGILFGAGSQVNTHSFLASTLSLFDTDVAQSNTTFFDNGFPLGAGSQMVLTGTGSAGPITLSQGAQITSGELGFVLIDAPHVTNAGTISATDGQITLAASSGILNIASNNGTQAGSQTAAAALLPLPEPVDSDYTLRNTGIIQSTRGNITLLGLNVEQDGVVAATTGVTRGGSITISALDPRDPDAPIEGVNTGALVFGGGSVTAILPEEDGQTTTSSVAATDSFNNVQTGAAPILNLSGGSVTFAGGSNAGRTAGALVEAPGATLNVAAVADGVYAPSLPGAGLNGRVFVGSGATLDVAGLANVQLPVSATLVTIGPLTQNDLADSPLLKDGFLYTATVTVDSTLSGTTANGQAWVGSPIINAAPYVQNIPRTIDQLLVNGGTVNLAGAEVMTTQGSSINVAGGYINYLGGMTTGTTRLLGSDGRAYDIGSADPTLTYVGFAGQQTVTQPRWNETATYINPVLSGGLDHFLPGFVQGGMGGALNIYVGGSGPGQTPDSIQGTAILNGGITASVVAGRNQVASGAPPSGASFSIGGPQGSPLTIYYFGATSFGPSFDIEAGVPTLQQIAQSEGLANFAPDTPLPAGTDPADQSNLQYWTPLNATALSAGGFASISISSPRGLIVEGAGAALAVTPGGALTLGGAGTAGTPDQIALSAGAITINGRLSAPVGLIRATTSGMAGGAAFDLADGDALPGDIQVGPTALLTAGGQWVNDTGLSPNQITGSAFINGGRITLTTQQSSYQPAGSSSIIDNTGSIDLAPGSALDVSSGGYIGPTGKLLMSGNVPAGVGGSISLVTYDGLAGLFGHQADTQPPQLPNGPGVPLSGSVNIAGSSLTGFGFAGGGTLTLQALGIQIGGTDASGTAVVAPQSQGGTLYLPASFFLGAGRFQDPTSGVVTAVGGFGSYVVNAEYGATVAAGPNNSRSLVQIGQQNLLPNYAALAKAPTGTNIQAGGATTLGSLDPFDSTPGSFTLTAGDYRNWGDGRTDYTSLGVPGNLLIEQGAELQASAGSSIVLGSPATVQVLGSVTANGGSITLDGMSGYRLVSPLDFALTDPAQAVELGAGAELNVSGTTLINPFATPVLVNGQRVIPVTGTLLPGGAVSLYGTDVAAAPGSVIDVSGTTAVLDVPQNVTSAGAWLAGVYAPAPQWSDAGNITVGAANSLYLESTFRATAGSGSGGSGSGGTLTVTSVNTGATTVELFQSANSLPAGSPLLLPAGWQPGDAIASGGGTLFVAVGNLGSSGIWNLAIGSNSEPANLVNQAPRPGQLTLAFAGDVDLPLRQSFTADAVAYAALPAPGDTSGSPVTVSIAAPYIALEGDFNIQSSAPFSPQVAVGGSTLNIGNLEPAAGPVTRLIDLGGDFSLGSFGQANFSSSGGIRFLTSYVNTAAQVPRPGELYTTGNLRFTAQELYPASGNSFVIVAGGGVDASGNPIPTTVDIEAAPGTAPSVPLSAGGSLAIDASSITQNGTLWVPSGSITLGVGNPGDPATQALFNSSPLVATGSVALGAGSTTSVSLGGAILPYGTTVDGQEWQYNSNPDVQSADLTAPPAKLISINATSISLESASAGRAAAAVDLSGGGSLQAEEWVPGIGGTHDVLSQFNTTFLSSPSGTQVPLYSDARGVYALVPSYAVPVAAYDPVFAQGQAPMGTGEAITVSGGNGIPAGTYVLMPAKYATLPGSFRVVQDTGIIDSVPEQNTVLADGTQLISGYYSNALTGARQSRSVTFELQSTDQGVWQQYSQYTLTSADSFFANLAAGSGVPTPQLPRDAGQLVLGASGSLTLGATLKTSAAPGGAAAQIDIASQDIQILGNIEQALPGYLQLSPASLDSLGAGSLLIGGTRSQTSAGLVIDPLAQSVVVSNDNSSPLTGNQIMLVASDTVQVDGGSLISAPAPTAGSAMPPGTPLIIGQASQPGSGNGALLMVSSAGPAPLSRISATGVGSLSVGQGVINGGGFLLMDSAGNTQVNGNATLTGKAITADAAAITFVGADTSQAIPGMVIGSATLAQLANASQVSLRSYGAIDFEGNENVSVGTAPGDSLELSAAAFTAGAFGNKGSQVAVTAPTLTLTNEADLNAQSSVAPAAGATRLAFSGSEIDLGSAAGSNPVLFSGFSSVNLNASPGSSGAAAGVVARNGLFNFGSVDVGIVAPVLLAASNSTTTLATTGALTLTPATGTPLPAQGLGGQLTLTAGRIEDTATVEAPAGNLALTATGGDVHIGGGAMLSVAGVAKQFFDVFEFAPGGMLSLTSQTGNVQVDPGSTLDFSGASGGGDAGALAVSAPQGSFLLPAPQAGQSAAVIKGGVAQAAYTSGSVSVSVGGSQDLDALAQVLGSSGATESLAVESGVGDLNLSAGNTLTAANVSLVANSGTVIVGGAIHADGTSGGIISLYGTQGVDLEGSLSAKGSSGPGGSVSLGTSGSWNPQTGTLNSTYGYESLDTSGTLTLGAGALIDVSGAPNAAGGTVSLRAPLLSSGDVNIDVGSGRIVGAGAITVEPYAVWSISDPVNNPAQHFDGYIDPAGWYDSSGHLVSGTFYNQDGVAVATGSNLCPDPASCTFLTQDFFVPDAANASHQSFYGYVNGDPTQGPGTLMGFVQTPGFSASFASRMGTLGGSGGQTVTVTPGIELDNPLSSGVNGGSIELLTNWNLGAGTAAASGAPSYVYRYNGAAPVLTLRAGNNLAIDASISDGFYQYSPGPDLTFSQTQLQAANTQSQQVGILTPAAGPSVAGSGGTTFTLGPPFYTGLVTTTAGTMVAPPLPGQSADYYAEYDNYAIHIRPWSTAIATLGTTDPYTINPGSLGSGAPSVSSYPATPAGYAQYTSAYNSWLTTTYPNTATLASLGTTPPPPQLPPGLVPGMQSSVQAYLTYLSAWTQYETYMNGLDGAGGGLFSTTRSGSTFAYIFPPLPPPGSTSVNALNAAIDDGNLPASVPSLDNVAPISYAALAGGTSSSYRLVAGADFSSADPLALAPASGFSAGPSGGGSVTLGAHTAVLDETSGLELVFPTTVRTGAGSIAVAAANDIALTDNVAPGVMYTAGVPVGGPSQGAPGTIRQGFGASSFGQELIVAAPVNPQGAGNLSLMAQNDILGMQAVFDDAAASLDGSTTGMITGVPGTYIGQSWWQWMQTANTPSASSINFSAFDQGVLSSGGNVSVVAGGNVTDLSVSLPTSWRMSSDGTSVTTYGGGNLAVSAGGDILSGSYFVASGRGVLRAGGSVASGFSLPDSGTAPGSEVSTLLGLQNGQIQVTARGGVDLGGIFDPSYLESGFDSQSYSSSSSVNVVSVGGDVQLGTLTQAQAFFNFGYQPFASVLPATLSVAALQGGINVEAGGALYPSPTGELTLVAQGDINLYSALALPANANLTLQMIDEAPQSLPSPLDPLGTSTPSSFLDSFSVESSSEANHGPIALHANDTVPARIYSLGGSIIDGELNPAGFYVNSLLVAPDKEAFIQAGDDIVNLNFAGQNLRNSDFTRIVAGRDIYDTPLKNTSDGGAGTAAVPALLLGGPGTFDIEAGRNIGPLTNQDEAVTEGYVFGGTSIVTTGIDAVGNAFNPFLAHQSASVSVLFGVAPGIDTADFIAKYLGDMNSPLPGLATAIAGVPDYTPQLIAFMTAYQAGLSYTYSDGLLADHITSVSLNAAQAWAAFKQLPNYVQNQFLEQVFNNVLFLTGQNYNDPTSLFFHQYARGYEAINTLFPASFGYTANNLTGGTNGAQLPITTGNLDLRSSTIQTQQGGDINIFGPGGQALLGSDNAPPYFVNGAGTILAGPNTIGVLTLEQGNINIFTDQSLLLAQSRVFTEQGGNILMWSSNGDINAGNGLKSTSFVPPLTYTCDDYNYCIINPAGEVTGAGIATLQTIPGAPPGDVELITPRGTVDAGQAGIRVSGNLTIAALHVANVFNIQVQGKEIGVPNTAVDTGALAAANNAASATEQAAALRPTSPPAELQITVEVVGYGIPDEEEQKRLKARPQ